MINIVACTKCGRPRAQGHRCTFCADSALCQQPADQGLGAEDCQGGIAPGITCPHCGASVRTEARFCATCGASLGATSPQRPGPASLAHPPRRLPWHATLAGRLGALVAILVVAVVVAVAINSGDSSAEESALSEHSAGSESGLYEATPDSEKPAHTPTTVEQVVTSGNVQIVVTRDVITLAMYESIQVGDTYEEVLRKLPRGGVTVQRDDSERTILLAWQNSDGSAMHLAFEGDVVMSKKQSGLR